MKPNALFSSMLWAGFLASGQVFAEAQFSWSTGLDYSTGDYGTSQTTEIWYVPFTAKLAKDDWQFRLTLPYVRITGSSGGTLIGYDDNGVPIYSGGTRATETGLGDVVAAVSYSLLNRQDLLLDMTAKIKFGTADEDKGLGSGETDYGLAFDAYLPMGRHTPFFNLGYRWRGDPAGVDLRNTFQAGLGLNYKFSEDWSFGGMYDWRAASTAGGESQRDFTLYGVYKAGPDWKLQGYASQGFSNASPDYSLGLIVKRSY